MSFIGRLTVFFAGTISNAILYLFLSRVVLEVIATGQEVAGSGPGTTAMNLLPVAIQLAIGGLQLGLILYLVAGISQERTSTRRPMR